MEQSSALQKLMETADLIKMVEDLISPGTLEKLSGQSLSGVRITLKTVRENVLGSHEQLASNYISQARTHIDRQGTGHSTADMTPPAAQKNGGSGAPITRSELRASLEKMIDR